MTSENSPYITLSKKVDLIKEPRVTICKKGMGFCCTANVPVIPDDQKRILDGIKTGKILPQVVKDAVIKSGDTNTSSCPFLGENKECTIYEQRPLLCRVWGRAGFPNRESLPTFQKNLILLKEKGEDIQMEQKDLSICACRACAIPLILENPSYPTSTLKTIAETHLLYQKPNSGRIGMNEFINQSLKE